MGVEYQWHCARIRNNNYALQPWTVYSMRGTCTRDVLLNKVAIITMCSAWSWCQGMDYHTHCKKLEHVKKSPQFLSQRASWSRGLGIPADRAAHRAGLPPPSIPIEATEGSWLSG